MAVDWWEIAKIVPGIGGALTGGLALYFNRRDARRTAIASQPTATVSLNPHPESDGWFVMKLTFEKVSRAFILTTATIKHPSGAVVATRKTIDNIPQRSGNGDRSIKVHWNVDLPRTPGAAAGFAHLNIKPKYEGPAKTVRLTLEGHYISGMQERVKIECKAQSTIGLNE